jgi:hypothetical protein
MLRLLALVLVIVVVGACTSCANEWEPRLCGKAAVFQRLKASTDARVHRHVLPCALVTHPSQVAEASAALGWGSSECGWGLVVKPNALTSCGHGVRLVNDARALTDAVCDILRYSPALLQRRAAATGGIEARLFGAFALADSVWEWDPVVYTSTVSTALLPHTDFTRVPVSEALRSALRRVMRALPGVFATAIDVRALSLAALQRGEFVILEVNGVGGVPHVWQVPGRDFFPWGLAALAVDLVRWMPPRFVLGVRNLLEGRINMTERALDEWTYFVNRFSTVS